MTTFNAHASPLSFPPPMLLGFLGRNGLGAMHRLLICFQSILQLWWRRRKDVVPSATDIIWPCDPLVSLPWEGFTKWYTDKPFISAEIVQVSRPKSWLMLSIHTLCSHRGWNIDCRNGKIQNYVGQTCTHLTGLFDIADESNLLLKGRGMSTLPSPFSSN